MPTFEAKYSDEQREAVAVAYLDRRVRPAGRVAELAARGELVLNGRSLEPFEMPAQSVRAYAAALRKARGGQLKSGLTDKPPKDAVEALRIRLVSAADNMLAKIENRQERGKPDSKDPELLRQIARATREIAAIPGKDDPRPVPPGQKIPGAGGAKDSERTSGGLAGSILNAHRTNGVHTTKDDPYRSASTTQDQDGEQSAAQHHHEAPTAQEDSAPGAWVREQVGDLA